MKNKRTCNYVIVKFNDTSELFNYRHTIAKIGRKYTRLIDARTNKEFLKIKNSMIETLSQNTSTMYY